MKQQQYFDVAVIVKNEEILKLAFPSALLYEESVMGNFEFVDTCCCNNELVFTQLNSQLSLFLYTYGLPFPQSTRYLPLFR